MSNTGKNKLHFFSFSDFLCIVKRHVKGFLALILLSLSVSLVYAFVFEKESYTSNGLVILITDPSEDEKNNNVETKSDSEIYQDLHFTATILPTVIDFLSDDSVLAIACEDINQNQVFTTTYTPELIKEKNYLTVSSRTYDYYEKSLYVDVSVTTENQELSLELTKAILESAYSLSKDESKPFRKVFYNTFIVSLPSSEAVESSFSKPLIVLIGFIIGLVLGCLYCFLYQTLDNQVTSMKEMEYLTGENYLGAIPSFKIENSNQNKGLKPIPLKIRNRYQHHEDSFSIKDFNSPIAESVLKIVTNVTLASKFIHGLKVIGITSAVESEGKSTLSVNLANCFAYQGSKTCLINLDLRKPTLHHFYHLKNQTGITEYVLGEASVDQIINKTAAGVDLINAGTLTPFATKTIGSKKMKELISILRTRYDVILVDLPPVLLVPDSLIVSSFIDSYLLVTAMNYSKKKNVEEVIDTFRENKLSLLGLIMSETTFDENISQKNYSYKANPLF